MKYNNFMGRGKRKVDTLMKRSATGRRTQNEDSFARLAIDKEWLENHLPSGSTCAFTVATVDTPDGEPILGLSYSCDFRAEEEYGVGDLRKALTGTDERRFQMLPKALSKVATFSDVNGLVVSTRDLDKSEFLWGEDVVPGPYGYHAETSPDYVNSFTDRLAGIQGSEYISSWEKISELKARAKTLGLTKLPTKKADLYDLVVATQAAQGKKKYPEDWPGWFHYGRQLVLRADGDGPTARVLKHLADAARSGTLGIGGKVGSNPFGSGLFLYDTRDETKGLKDEVDARHRWYNKQMKRLEKTEKMLKKQGFHWDFLGNPREDEEGIVRYWVNNLGEVQNSWQGERNPDFDPETKALLNQLYNKIVYGWFTLEELENANLFRERVRAEIKDEN